MPGEEEKMALTRWRDLLGAELMLALGELSKIRKNDVNERHEYYVENCAEQYWKTISRITATIGERPGRQNRAINVTITEALARLKAEREESGVSVPRHERSSCKTLRKSITKRK